MRFQWPTKKEWAQGWRVCTRCGRKMRKGQYTRISNPPEYLGNGYDHVHRTEIVCRHGFFHCPKDRCDHKKANPLFFICTPKQGFIVKKAPRGLLRV